MKRMIRSFQSACLQKHLIAPGIYELRLSKPEGFTFLPGQFVLFDVPLIENLENIQTRAYSIASAPQEPDLLFVIKLMRGGRASRWIEDKVTTGTVFTLKGPFGKFTLDEGTTKPYLFVATSTGVAPFRSQILPVLQKGVTCRIDLVAGVVRKEDFFWEEQWRALEEYYPNFRAHASFLSGEPDWHGETGSVQERISRLITDPSNVSIYICGATEMVQETKRLCVTLGVRKEDVHTEAYI